MAPVGGAPRSHETSMSWALASNSDDNSSGAGGGDDDHDGGESKLDEKKTSRANFYSNKSNSNNQEMITVINIGNKEGIDLEKQSKKRDSDGRLKKYEKGNGEIDHEMHIWTERERRKKMRNMFSNLHALLPQLPPKADKSTIVDEAVKYIKTLQLTLQRLQKKKLEKLQYSAGYSTTTTTINYDDYEQQPPPMTLMSSRDQGVGVGASSSCSGLDTTTCREAFLGDLQVSSSPTCSFALQSSKKNNTCSCSNSGAAAAGPIFSVPVPVPPPPPPQFPVIFQTWTSSNVVLNVCGDEAQITVCSTRKRGLLTAICFVLDKYKIEVTSAHVSSNGNQTIFMIQAHACGPPDLFPDMIPPEDIYKQAAGEIMLWAG